MSQFAVPASSLGHHFQSHYALHLLLEVASEDPLATMTVERIDDVAIESSHGAIESIQTKQHSEDVGLGNAAPDIWKTIRAWLESFGTAHEPALFTLVTTSVAQHGSAAYCLRPESFDLDTALTLLNAVPRTSKNESNKLAYAAFEALPETDRRRFISRIRVLDGVAPAVALTKKIHKQLAMAVDRTHVDEFFLRLLGWWEERLTRHLAAPLLDCITADELLDRVASLRDQFSTSNLPIDDDIFEMTIPENDLTDRMFMHQLRLISLSNDAMMHALREYFRAYVQRSRWVKEDLVNTDELPRYERRLREEWERHFAIRQSDYDSTTPESEKKKIGLEIYRHLTERDFRIRENCSEPWVMRGSFHMLADSQSVGWHPDFVERLKQVLANAEAEV